jgi:hypothetical protein
MPSKALIESWKQTTAYLLDARANFSEASEGICSDEFIEFSSFLEHNELGLALDSLEAAWEKSGLEDFRVLEFIALAAASMGMFDRVKRFDDFLSRSRGIIYTTKL